LLTGGNDLFETKLAVAENSDESNEHGDLRCCIRLAQAMQGSCQQGARSALKEIGP
jgi:hypothetical protein